MTLKLDSRIVSSNGVKVPNKKSGVYEAKHEDEEERLAGSGKFQ